MGLEGGLAVGSTLTRDGTFEATVMDATDRSSSDLAIEGSDVGAILGARGMMSDHFEIGLRYQRGLSPFGTQRDFGFNSAKTSALTVGTSIYF